MTLLRASAHTQARTSQRACVCSASTPCGKASDVAAHAHTLGRRVSRRPAPLDLTCVCASVCVCRRPAPSPDLASQVCISTSDAPPPPPPPAQRLRTAPPPGPPLSAPVGPRLSGQSCRATLRGPSLATLRGPSLTTLRGPSLPTRPRHRPNERGVSVPDGHEPWGPTAAGARRRPKAESLNSNAPYLFMVLRALGFGARRLPTVDMR